MTTGPSSVRAWTVEAYRPGDEIHILELFRREFGVERSEAHWRWKFLENPYGGPFISLAWHGDPRFLVGNQVLMPVPLNVDGRRVLAGHSLDLVVHRGFRRQGVFEQTGRHAMETLRQAAGEAVVAFPNASSYPGFVRSLGWSRILEPTRWSLRLGLRGKLERSPALRPFAHSLGALYQGLTGVRLRRALASARAATARLSVSHAEQLPGQTDALWEREARSAALSLWKDRTYLSWRYERNPDHRFTYHLLERDTELVGLAVSVVRQRTSLLCELLVPERDVAAGRRLVLESCFHDSTRGAEVIQFLGHDRGWFADVLCDFTRRVAPENVFVGRALSDDVLNRRMADPAQWTLAYGDGDFV